ncbi:M15 family metallopeptidase [Kineococcus sp. GCM10028916]|uniref:M15 family metallopeptidase n=1 Tax=Kineococcus sp. GCM10028916 TaxID=3273394 RepID=UPI00362D83D8
MGRSLICLLVVPLLAGCAAVSTTTPSASSALVTRGTRVTSSPMLPAYTAVISPVGDLSASWRAGCPVAPADLRVVTVTVIGFDGKPGTGRIVVAADVAQATADVFGSLYAMRYPVARMEPVEAFGGSDDASMAADNTSAFNCRATTGGTGFSEHSYGTAIDLNPVENPYVKGSTVLPEAGRAFVERKPAPGVVVAGDAVVRAFADRGFSWGGDWNSLKDYQHFSISGD